MTGAPASTLSPRTPDQPMAFTRDEFVMGAVSSWLFFLGLLAAAEVSVAVVSDVMGSLRGGPSGFSSVGLLGPVLLISLLIAAPISGIAALLTAPVIRRLAWRLRTRRSPWLHVAAHAAIGAAVGALTIAVLQLCFLLWTDAAAPLPQFAGYCLIAAPLTAASTVLGWAVTVRNARRWDSGRSTARRVQARIDRDAVVEDGALEL